MTTAIADAWEKYRRIVVPPNATLAQITETRQAFFAGSSFLFYFLLKVLEPGDEASEADLRRMAELQSEIDAFGLQLDVRVLGALARHKGSN